MRFSNLEIVQRKNPQAQNPGKIKNKKGKENKHSMSSHCTSDVTQLSYTSYFVKIPPVGLRGCPKLHDNTWNGIISLKLTSRE